MEVAYIYYLLALGAGAVLSYIPLNNKISILKFSLKQAEDNLNRIQADKIRLEEDKQAIQSEVIALRESLASLKTKLEEEIKASKEKLEFKEKTIKDLQNTFESLASAALKRNNESFLNLAETKFETLKEATSGELEKRKEEISRIVDPLQKIVERVVKKTEELGSQTTREYGKLAAQIQKLYETEAQLAAETRNLTTIMKAPTLKGQWGEFQLQRVIEFAGMQEYCDYRSQKTSKGENDNSLRPDVIVQLPGGGNIVIDAKSPGRYIDILNAENEEERKKLLKSFILGIKKDINSLSKKNYQGELEGSPEFIVMFLPAESIFRDALTLDPSLLEYAVKEKVVIATPTTLIALLKAVAYGWRQEALTTNAKEISRLGKELYKRVGKFAEHLSELQKKLEKTVQTFNKVISSFERRLMPIARDFDKLGAASNDKVRSIQTIGTAPKTLISSLENNVKKEPINE